MPLPWRSVGELSLPLLRLEKPAEPPTTNHYLMQTSKIEAPKRADRHQQGCILEALAIPQKLQVCIDWAAGHAACGIAWTKL